MSHQATNRIERALREALRRGCESGVFPGASASVAFHRGGVWSAVDVAEGSRDVDGAAVEPDTVYDLASLTKPWVAMSAIGLHQGGLFDLNAEVSALVPEAFELPIGRRRWEEVLTHRSGLDAWHPFFSEVPAEADSEGVRAWFLDTLLPRWEAKRVGTSLYSDLGYILAGFGLERATGLRLETLVAERLAARIEHGDEVFYVPAARERDWVQRCAPTGRSEWRGKTLIGEVHDDNCAALRGVAGHAGMFGTARAIRAFGCAWVAAWHGRRGSSDEEAIRFATVERAGGPHRLGWDGKAPVDSSAGSLMGPRSFGHLGFTGTSLWCDPDRQLVIALLTNRVAVSDDNVLIRAFRPTFHDAVVDAFER